jgi:hypothetical protein
MIVRLNPFIPVETPIGKGNAIFYINSKTQERKYWIINSKDNSIRIFHRHEIELQK